MSVMAVCNCGGLGLRAPFGGREAGQVIIGTALRLYFTPVVAREVASYWPIQLMAALLAIVLGSVSGWFLSRVTGTDRTTAFFASVPGGATEMVVLGERYGARTDRVAMAQSLRILVVVILIPCVLTYSGAHGADVYEPRSMDFDWRGLRTLFGIATAVGGACLMARVPNAFMLGPLAAVIALSVYDARFSSMPSVISNVGQALIGCALGARFEQRFLRGAPRYIIGVLASVLISIVLAALAGLARLSGLPLPSLLLATAPDGMAEMAITAKVLQLGVPLVTATQVTRVVVLVTSTGPVYHLARRLSEGAGKR
ncbi:MAG: AbrB family transcriptional regulator [Betaproteobacteria bacterium]|nr:AbrB family transcriptional regulator [Betaproteobacteria bacterium]